MAQHRLPQRNDTKDLPLLRILEVGLTDCFCLQVSGNVRIAAQNRWIPWWINHEFAGQRGLSASELQALPESLQPLMRHLCPDVPDGVAQAM